MTDTNPTTPDFDLDAKNYPTVALGTPVIYVGTKGHAKAAQVVGTPESVDEGTSLPTLAPGQLHLAVWDFGAAHYTPRFNVPFEGQVADVADFQSDGKTVGVWRTIA